MILASVDPSIGLGEILSICTTVVVASALFFFYYRAQVQTSRATRDIARLALVQELEGEVSALFREKVVRTRYQSGVTDAAELRFALDNEPPWQFIPEDGDSRTSSWPTPKHQVLDGRRHWVVRVGVDGQGNEYTQLVGSEAFQDTLLWFRRVERAYRAKILLTKDLCDLGRFILPFGFSGRLVYFLRYFQGQGEVSAMRNLILETLEGCCDLGRHAPVSYLVRYVTHDDQLVLFQDRDDLYERAKSLVSRGDGQATN